MAVMASPDFASYFGSEKLSDCFVNLSEEPDPSEPGVNRKRKQHSVPGHSMVLVAFSHYCKTKVPTVMQLDTVEYFCI